VSPPPPVFYALAMLAEITWSGVGEKLIATAIAAVVTAVVTALVMLPVIRYQTRDLVRAVARLTKSIADHEKQIARIRQERTECQLHAAHEYASKDELVRLVADGNRNTEKIYMAVQDVHGRVTRLSEELHEFRGRTGGNT